MTRVDRHVVRSYFIGLDLIFYSIPPKRGNGKFQIGRKMRGGGGGRRKREDGKRELLLFS